MSQEGEMDNGDVFAYIGVYDSKEEAQRDYYYLQSMHQTGAVGAYDAAIVSKDHKGNVHISKDETSTRHGAWTGLAVGALVGALFPVSLLAGGVAGAAAGGVIGHVRKGLSRSDLDEFGQALDEGKASLVVIGRESIQDVVANEMKRQGRAVERKLDIDGTAFAEELQRAAGKFSD